MRHTKSSQIIDMHHNKVLIEKTYVADAICSLEM